MPPSAHPSVSAARRSIPPATAVQKPRQTLRVAVIPSESDRAEMTVRILPDGKSAPPDGYEAMIVCLEAGADMTAKKRP